MIIAQYFVYFILYSFLGWVWETVYCTIKQKHFANRGFLYGPICPIYGSAVITMQLMFRFFKGFSDGSMPVWELFLICAVGSAVLEYATSFYLEKRFHARWWDYSSIPLNVNGRICLPVTLCFGAAGVAIVKFLLPLIGQHGDNVHPLIYEAAALGLMAVFGADFALTEAALNQLLPKIEAVEKEFTDRAEALYTTVASTPQEIEAKVHGFELELSARAHTYAESLSSRQKYIFENIQSFRPKLPGRHAFHAGERVKEALKDLRK